MDLIPLIQEAVVEELRVKILVVQLQEVQVELEAVVLVVTEMARILQLLVTVLQEQQIEVEEVEVLVEYGLLLV